LFRVTLRRLDLAAEIFHLRQPQTIPLVISADEAKRLLAVTDSLKARVLLRPQLWLQPAAPTG
jgi:integrase/recombinase XerD